MSKDNEKTILELGLVSSVKISEKGFLVTSRPFTCPPGFLYCVFRNTSAGPEFIQSFGPNEKGTLEKEQDIYRVSIGGAPARIESQESFILVDGNNLDVLVELSIKITDGAKVARSVVQDKVDPLTLFKQDIRNMLDDDITPLDYEKIFVSDSRDVKINNHDLEDKIKKSGKATLYGLSLDGIRIKVILPSDLRKKREDDISSRRILESKKDDIDRRKKEVELKKEINKLTSEENKLDAELEVELEKIKNEHLEYNEQRDRRREDEALERERKLKREEERERQSEIRGETTARIEIQNLELQARFDQQAAEQRQQIRREEEKKIHERNEAIESLRQQVNTNQITEEIEGFRRRQEEYERIHQLRLERLKELADLQFDRMRATTQLEITKLQEEQKRLLSMGQQEADLGYQYKLLEYREKETIFEIKKDRAQLENKEIHEQRLARIELGKELVRARINLMERLSTGESHLTPEQIRMLNGIDPLNERSISRDQIENLVEAIDEYMSSGSGAEKVRNVLRQLKNADKNVISIDDTNAPDLIDVKNPSEQNDDNVPPVNE